MTSRRLLPPLQSAASAGRSRPPGCSSRFPLFSAARPAARRPAHRQLGPPTSASRCRWPRSCFAVVLFFDLLGKSGADRSIDDHLFTWIPVAGFHVDAALPARPAVDLLRAADHRCRLADPHLLDRLHGARPASGAGSSATSTCSSPRCCCSCSADNYLLVSTSAGRASGLASYLLIGFWYYKPSAATAAKKAFVVNRVGDVGLSIAIMLMFATFGSTSFDAVFCRASHASNSDADGDRHAAAARCLRQVARSSRCSPGCCDAMEGPTPVSALIHAATMVTAGVYLVARSNAIFDRLAHGGAAGRHRRRRSRCSGRDHRLRPRRHQEGRWPPRRCARSAT